MIIVRKDTAWVDNVSFKECDLPGERRAMQIHNRMNQLKPVAAGSPNQRFHLPAFALERL